ncbi:MAG: hypothetical protein B7Z42_14510 [Brevundimonas sp. 12-68-7]|uniref:Uncharacterized protein n=1 Tax=Brevundimonas subvibrioides TaxID=74313 RepID=A0A258FE59_9CAUL|nr:MAG: hypothetical protein B7Z42_14510 [Brevundimonas sp. 12-68-7]OYX30338.1 MAG: hypothetical protein B7Z01_14535 [Brevundimonas subvibrioides]
MIILPDDGEPTPKWVAGVVAIVGLLLMFVTLFFQASWQSGVFGLAFIGFAVWLMRDRRKR